MEIALSKKFLCACRVHRSLLISVGITALFLITAPWLLVSSRSVIFFVSAKVAENIQTTDNTAKIDSGDHSHGRPILDAGDISFPRSNNSMKAAFGAKTADDSKPSENSTNTATRILDSTSSTWATASDSPSFNTSKSGEAKFGIQFKVRVEYAPFQCVPKPWTKKDGREGTIFNDPEYLEFVELLMKPAENLPSAEIQLERREAERAGAAKEAPIVTPLMDFIRQKRAAKSGPQRISGNGKPSGRAVVTGNCSSLSSKHGSEKRRGLTLMRYVSKNNVNNESDKEKQTYILVPRRDERLSKKSTDLPSMDRREDTQVETGAGLNGTVSGVPISVETGKKTLLLLKGKERGSSHDAASQIRTQGSASFKHIQQQEAPGRIIRSILTNKERHQVLASQSDPQLINGNIEKDRRPPRPPIPSANSKERAADGKSLRADRIDSNESRASISDYKHDRRTRNKDRPDRAVWAPLRGPDGSHARGTKLRSDNEIPFDHGELKHGGGRVSCALDNGTQRHVGRRGSSRGLKELDSSTTIAEGKPLKRGPPCYGSHEKQVWVQKSGSAS